MTGILDTIWFCKNKAKVAEENPNLNSMKKRVLRNISMGVTWKMKNTDDDSLFSARLVLQLDPLLITLLLVVIGFCLLLGVWL